MKNIGNPEESSTYIIKNNLSEGQGEAGSEILVSPEQIESDSFDYFSPMKGSSDARITSQEEPSPFITSEFYLCELDLNKKNEIQDEDTQVFTQ